MGILANLDFAEFFEPVSNQLISPASGDSIEVVTAESEMYARVSNQLISPASGDSNSSSNHFHLILGGFHSINIPSEWGSKVGQTLVDAADVSFQSINIPSEWGFQKEPGDTTIRPRFVFPIN